MSRVIEESRKACGKLQKRPLTADKAADLAQAIMISAFLWTMKELSRLEQL